MHTLILCTENQPYVETNVALWKTSYQSSTEHSGSSSLAVDGSTIPFYFERSCTHTDYENKPWWQVDLGQLYTVAAVIIYNRFYYYPYG